jgi:hypothetical protein
MRFYFGNAKLISKFSDLTILKPIKNDRPVDFGEIFLMMLLGYSIMDQWPTTAVNEVRS